MLLTLKMCPSSTRPHRLPCWTWLLLVKWHDHTRGPSHTWTCQKNSCLAIQGHSRSSTLTQINRTETVLPWWKSTALAAEAWSFVYFTVNKNLILTCTVVIVPVLRHCWLGIWKAIRPAKNLLIAILVTCLVYGVRRWTNQWNKVERKSEVYVCVCVVSWFAQSDN